MERSSFDDKVLVSKGIVLASTDRLGMRWIGKMGFRCLKVKGLNAFLLWVANGNRPTAQTFHASDQRLDPYNPLLPESAVSLRLGYPEERAHLRKQSRTSVHVVEFQMEEQVLLRRGQIL